MKFFIVTFSFAIIAVSAFGLEIKAKAVSGFDNISKTHATDCSYISQVDGLDSSLLAVGLQSKSAPYNNVLIRIPTTAIPLTEGFSIKDIRGFQIVYRDGVLSAQRTKSGEGASNEVQSLELVISENLDVISAAKTQKLEGLVSKTPLSEMKCEF